MCVVFRILQWEENLSGNSDGYLNHDTYFLFFRRYSYCLALLYLLFESLLCNISHIEFKIILNLHRVLLEPSLAVRSFAYFYKISIHFQIFSRKRLPQFLSHINFQQLKLLFIRKTFHWINYQDIFCQKTFVNKIYIFPKKFILNHKTIK